jgi:tetratricopeptide (TPR) repeat protein
MFGNTKGWIISGVIFLAVGFLFVYTGLLTVPPISKPTGKFPLTEKLELPGDPKQWLAPMTRDADAAESYRKAIREFDLNEKDYEKNGRIEKDLKTYATAADKPKGVEFVVEAADCERMNLFESSPEKVVHYNSTWPDLNALNEVGTRTLQIGMWHIKGSKDYAQAEKYINAAFSLGYRLYNERLCWEELNHGMNLMINASKQLGRVAEAKGEADRAAQLSKFSDELNKYKTDQVVPIVKVLTTINSQTVGDRGGDIFGLLRQSPERVWKVESLLALGRMKFNTPNRGDQIGAKREVKRFVADPDPAVKEAAKIADQMTILQYRTLGS